MATNNGEVIFQCSDCQKELDMEAKTLPCLHSLCGRCLDKDFQGKRNGQCPQCHEIVKIDELTLSPVLVSALKCRQMELDEWKCDLCLEDGDELIAINWCSDCVKFFCTTCSRVHKKLHQNHNSIELDENGKDRVRKVTRTDMCNLHNRVEESYCSQCNMCLCDTCYQTHLNESPQCSSRPISVREGALKKVKSQGPTLLKEIEDLENNLLERNRKSRIYIERLEKQYNLKCENIWWDYAKILKELRDKMSEICERLKLLKNEQVETWHQSVEGNERMLKKLDILRINLYYLLKKDQKPKDIVCGLQLVETKLASPQLYQNITEPERECELGVRFSNYYLQFLEGLKNEMIGFGCLHYLDDLIEFETEWNLPRSHPNREIQSFIVSQDHHIFLADYRNNSVLELTESGELVSECILKQELREFYPCKIFFSSSEILGVNCRWGKKMGGNIFMKGEKLLFLERQKISPFLKIKKIIDKNKQNSSSFSVCKIEKTILICDVRKFQIYFYSENGEYIKTIDTGEPGGRYCPLIRADPSTGNFWGAIPKTNKILCFNENGQILESIETKEEIWDFSINEFGNFYFCNNEGIFSIFPKKNLHKFQKNSEGFPSIFISKEKLFVLLKIDKKYLIRIFNVLH